MAAACRFEPEAREEYHDSIRYYASVADNERVALSFIAAFEQAIAAICANPELWRIVGKPEVRRYVIRRFPFVVYYRYQADQGMVVVYAVFHTGRRPGSWHGRLPPESTDG